MSSGQAHVSAGAAELVHSTEALVYLLRDDGTFPNNSKLPLLIYPGALALPDHEAKAIEHLLASNHWSGSWRNGIYSYHHYHSTAHEVLAVYAGSAAVQLGGEGGVKYNLRAGDLVIIPAGVAHKNLGSSADFAVIGAYPDGQEWDMCYGKPDERPEADHNIAQVPLPKADPVYGLKGPLMGHWLGF